MEGNRDEAERCIEIGVQAINSSNHSKARKFLEKAQNLYPDKNSEIFLRSEHLLRYLSKMSGGGGGAQQQNSDSEIRNRKSDAKEKFGDGGINSAHPEPNYTKEQIELVQKIKKCKDYYEVLGITKETTDSDIKKSYKKIALQLHPDKNHAPGASEAFKIVANAVSTLTDAQKRKEYDLYGGKRDISSGQNFASRRHHHGPSFEYTSFNGFESDISAEELFNIFFGGFPPQTRTRQRFGQNHHHYREQQNYQQYDSSPQPSIAFGLIMVLIIISMLSSFFTSDPLYSLSQTPKYSVQRQTSHLGVPYFVKDNFAEEYQGSLGRLENSVEEDYIYTMKQNCYRERSYRDSMISRARAFGSRAQLAQAQTLKTPSCDNLSKIGLARYSLY